MKQTIRSTDPITNPDPITHAPGAHVVGTGLGAAAGGAVGVAGAVITGAVMGTVAGPIGVVAGAAVGAVVGGLAGKAVAEDVNPTIEEKYWFETYKTRPYAVNKSFEQYGPAYRYGWESYGRYTGRGFDEVVIDLERDWDGARGNSHLVWTDAQPAARDAWDRLAKRHKKS